VRVEVRLFATLTAFLPPQSRDGAVTLDLPSGSTVHDAMQRLGIPAEMERVALLNGGDATPESSLHPGDVVTVFPPLTGGR
jgi:molybdopterin synthase sulfur carrier subunit